VVTNIGIFGYDYLCIAAGAMTNFFGNQELEKNCMQLKSIPDALDLRSAILQEFEKALVASQAGNVDRILNFVVVGGGPTGVETAGAIAEMQRNVLPADYKELDPSRMKVHLVEASPKVLGAFHEKSSAGALKFLAELGVQVHLGVSVQSYDGKAMKLSNGEVMETETVIWSAGVMGNTIAGLPKETIARGNRYIVNRWNQLVGYENIFAIGDIAMITGDEEYPRGHPGVAPVAVQQAQLFAKNLIRLIQGEQPQPFRYFDKGSMATVGRHRAVFESFGIRMQGYIAWLAWMFLHLMILVGFRNRLIVFVNWTWNYLSYQRAIRIITRPFIRGRA
jgi:NADH dehydrogenase